MKHASVQDTLVAGVLGKGGCRRPQVGEAGALPAPRAPRVPGCWSGLSGAWGTHPAGPHPLPVLAVQPGPALTCGQPRGVCCYYLTPKAEDLLKPRWKSLNKRWQRVWQPHLSSWSLSPGHRATTVQGTDALWVFTASEMNFHRGHSEINRAFLGICYSIPTYFFIDFIVSFS